MAAKKVNKQTGKSKGGRPTKYLAEYSGQVYKLCLLGATDAEIADFFKIRESTLNLWKKNYPEFSEAIKRGKDLADATVASKLFHRATGYSHPDVDIKMYEGEIIETQLVKHYPPDTVAAIFWLKNRQRTKWRDKQDLDVNNVGRVTVVHEYKTQETHVPLAGSESDIDDSRGK